MQFWCGGVFSFLVRLGFLVLGEVVCSHVVFFIPGVVVVFIPGVVVVFIPGVVIVKLC